MNPDQFDVSSDPDNVTMELAVYGTQYGTVKTAFYQIDAMIHLMEEENASIIADMDLLYLKNFMAKTPDLLFVPDNQIPETHRKTVSEIRTYVQNIDAIAELERWRVDVDLWGRMHGAAQYGERMIVRGIPPQIWETASHHMNKQPIAYETVKEASE